MLNYKRNITVLIITIISWIIIFSNSAYACMPYIERFVLEEYSFLDLFTSIHTYWLVLIIIGLYINIFNKNIQKKQIFMWLIIILLSVWMFIFVQSAYAWNIYSSSDIPSQLDTCVWMPNTSGLNFLQKSINNIFYFIKDNIFIIWILLHFISWLILAYRYRKQRTNEKIIESK